MKMIDSERDCYVRIIRDQRGNIAHKGSITKFGKDKHKYTCHKEFSALCRGYATKRGADEVLSMLNKKSIAIGFDITFHIELYRIGDIGEKGIPKLSEICKQCNGYEEEEENKLIEII